MATTTRVLTANVNGTAYTSNANGALEAIDTSHAGTTAPTNEVSNGKLWLDTTSSTTVLAVYNNAGWDAILTRSGNSIIDGSLTVASVAVSGDVSIGDDLFLNGPNPKITLTDNSTALEYTEIYNSSGNLIIQSRNGTADGIIMFRGFGGGSSTEFGRFDDTGYFGIGTTNPSQRLSVNGNIWTNSDVISAGLRVTGTGDTVASISSTGNGDADATLKIDASDTGESVIEFNNDTNKVASISLVGSATGDWNFSTVSGANRNFDFQPNNSLAMRITPTGNVGIGYTTPSEKLSVDGNITASGTMTATDFAGDGSALTGIDSPVKAWVNFNGTGTLAIRDSMNVSSVTDNGTGDYTVIFATAMANANYAVSFTISNSSTSSAVALVDNWNLPTTAQVRVKTFNSANAGAINPTVVSVVVYS